MTWQKRQLFVTPVKQIHDMAKKTAICHTSEANSCPGKKKTAICHTSEANSCPGKKRQLFVTPVKQIHDMAEKQDKKVPIKA